MDKKVLVKGYGVPANPWVCTMDGLATESQVIQILEKYLNKQTEFDKTAYDFDIYTEDGETYLYSYLDGEVYNKRSN